MLVVSVWSRDKVKKSKTMTAFRENNVGDQSMRKRLAVKQ